MLVTSYLSNFFQLLHVLLKLLLPTTSNCTMTNEMTHVTGASRGINGLRSAHHISKTSMVIFFFIVFFETEIGWQHLRKI